jgi:ABC-type lipoprotein release transport system permease subunit
MKTLFKIAWRNLLRNKRRTLITTSAIFFAVFLTVSMRSMQLGMYDLNIDRSLDMFTGYLQIQKDGFQETQGIRKAFVLDNTAIDKNCSN